MLYLENLFFKFQLCYTLNFMFDREELQFNVLAYYSFFACRLPPARSAHGAAIYKNNLWIFAGYDGNKRYMYILCQVTTCLFIKSD